MAKIKFPSYIKEGGGRMDDAILVTRNGVSYMKPYRKRESLTEKQEEVRLAFATVVEDWKYLGGIISSSWALYADDTPATGYNLFIGKNVSLRRAGEALLLCRDMGEDVLMNFTASPGSSPGEITCEFLPVDDGRHITLFMRKVTEPGVKAPVTRHDAGSNPPSPFTVSGLEQGVQYQVYAIVTDAEYENACSVSQSVAALTAAG